MRSAISSLVIGLFSVFTSCSLVKNIAFAFIKESVHRGDILSSLLFPSRILISTVSASAFVNVFFAKNEPLLPLRSQ